MNCYNKEIIKPVSIAIIDSGIDTTKADLSKYIRTATGFRVNEKGCIVEDNNMEVAHEHGTAIALIIKHLCEDVEFISINILNERLATDGRVLIYALQKALSHNPDIIHLSLGTTKWKYIFPLKKIIKQAMKHDIFIVAAANNQGLRSYPAYLKGVIGVKAKKMDSEIEIDYKDNFFYAHVDTRNIKGANELSNHHLGNSMAAAYITGHIASIKYSKNNINYLQAIEDLKAMVLSS